MSKAPIGGTRPLLRHAGLSADPEETTVLEPDFEAVAGLRGHSHKPEQAWRSFAGIERAAVPPPLTAAVERVLVLARD